jgi:hypothetical protein
MRAGVFVTEATPKGTARSPQEYLRPLLILSGQEYATTAFGQLHHMICNALRGRRPRLAAESWGRTVGVGCSSKTAASGTSSAAVLEAWANAAVRRAESRLGHNKRTGYQPPEVAQETRAE